MTDQNRIQGQESEKKFYVTGQIIITRKLVDDDDLVSVEFSDELGIVDAMGMLEFAKIELISDTLGIERDEDGDDESIL